MTTLLVRLHNADHALLVRVIHGRRRTLDTAMAGITHMGGAPFCLSLVSLLSAWAPTRVLGVRCLLTLVLSHLMVQALKRGIHRARPALPVGLHALMRAPDRFSFPSGHATAALAIALPLGAALGLTWSLAVVPCALIVGLSRCYLGVHYPGDVVAGWGVALATHILLGPI